MKSALGDDGPLNDPQLERGERQAKMALYWGAIGMFKNPSSHRQVDFDDPTLVSEVILLAALLFACSIAVNTSDRRTAAVRSAPERHLGRARQFCLRIEP